MNLVSLPGFWASFCANTIDTQDAVGEDVGIFPLYLVRDRNFCVEFSGFSGHDESPEQLRNIAQFDIAINAIASS